MEHSSQYPATNVELSVSIDDGLVGTMTYLLDF